VKRVHPLATWLRTLPGRTARLVLDPGNPDALMLVLECGGEIVGIGQGDGPDEAAADAIDDAFANEWLEPATAVEAGIYSHERAPASELGEVA